jgi:hypothetical protein
VQRPNLERAAFLCAATASFVAAFVVYAASNPGVVELIDSGELMTALMCGGVAHPTGYPLFSLLGYLLAPLARHHNAAIVLPWLSHLPGALGIGTITWLTARWGARQGLASGWSVICALITACTMGMARSLWFTASEVEVYSLTFFLVVVELGIAITALELAPGETRRFTRLLLLWFFLFGLAAGNHATVLALLPVAIWLSVAQFQRATAGRRLLPLLLAGAWALLGLSILLQLPLRAAAGPLLNWGDPDHWQRFLRHIRGAQYGVWFLTRPSGTWLSAGADLLRTLLFEDIPLLLPVAAAALLTAPRRLLTTRLRKRSSLLLTTAACGFTLAWSYDIPDIRSYLLPAEAALTLLCGTLLIALYRYAGRWRWPITAMAAAVLSVSISRSAPATARGDYRVVDEYARTLLESLEPNAVLLTDRWDAYSAAIYLHFIEGLRPDVTLIDKELLRRSWYYAYLETQAPDLYAAIRPHAEGFLQAVAPFEAGRPYDSAKLQHHYVALCRGILSGGGTQRPGYALLDQPEGILRGWSAVPQILAWRVYPPGSPPNASAPLYPEALLAPPHIPPTGSALHDPRAMELAREHGRFALARARSREQAGDLTGVLRELERACRLLPDNEESRRWLSRVYSDLGEQHEDSTLQQQGK